MPKTSITERVIPWMAGICMPLFLIVLAKLWGVSDSMSAFAAENEVLKVRVTQNERAMLDIRASVNAISSSIQKMEVSQSTHNALIKSEMGHIKKDLKDFIRPKDPKN